MNLFDNFIYSIEKILQNNKVFRILMSTTVNLAKGDKRKN